MNHLFIIFTFLLVYSCGKTNHNIPHSKRISPLITTEKEEKPEGQYVAILKNINTKFNPYLRGAGTISIDKDQIIADVSFAGGEKEFLYSQQIRNGSRCPDKREDKNQDGYIDLVEAHEVLGNILFPLDGDISSQLSFDSIFPISDIYGSYIYSKVSDIDLFFRDLYSPPQIFSPYIKLKSNETFNPEGHLLVIQGISEEHQLPFSVKSSSRLSPHQGLPIACAVFRKILQAPGEEEN